MGPPVFVVRSVFSVGICPLSGQIPTEIGETVLGET
jgi:hypothetical protein